MRSPKMTWALTSLVAHANRVRFIILIGRQIFARLILRSEHIEIPDRDFINKYLRYDKINITSLNVLLKRLDGGTQPIR